MTDFHAHGKIILLGEHAVVYGHPALAGAISPGATARFVAGDGPLLLAVEPWGAEFTPGDGSDLGSAVGALGEHLGVRSGRLEATLHLPGGGGLGSSAALGVACARALADGGLSLEHTLAAALVWERVFHGSPSGVDHTLAAKGGIGVFTRADGLVPVRVKGALRVVLADSGERAKTRDMVESVARQRTRNPEGTGRTLDAIGALVRNAALCLPLGDLKTLGDMMNLNQMLLSALMLSTERLEALCAAARSAGALGAKLTGAGGGGCIVALVLDDKTERAVLDAMSALDAPAWAVTVAG